MKDGVAEISPHGGDARARTWERVLGRAGGPPHLHTALPHLQLQLPHPGLPLSHHGLQLGDQAAALLSLAVELLVQAVLGCTCLLLLQTQAPQSLLELLQLVLGPGRRAGEGGPLGKEGHGKTGRGGAHSSGLPCPSQGRTMRASMSSSSCRPFSTRVPT